MSQYKESGVDIASGAELAKWIGKEAAKTKSPEVISEIGGFSGLFALPSGYQEPVLVACTDGVGTKVRLAQMLKDFSGIGKDLVAMCVNDLVVTGAKPLFFLDYYATGKLDMAVSKSLMTSIIDACAEAGMTLLGGETAEMPHHYKDGDIDVAGFCVGVVERSKIINKHNVKEGMAIVGIEASGLHANGFSLVRKVFKIESKKSVGFQEADVEKFSQFLRPTHIYAKLVEQVLPKLPIASMAHITGGGLTDNIPRSLPVGLGASIKTLSWPMPKFYTELQLNGGIAEMEIFQVFNCGIGFVFVLEQEHVGELQSIARECGFEAWEIGRCVAGEGVAYS